MLRTGVCVGGGTEINHTPVDPILLKGCKARESTSFGCRKDHLGKKTSYVSFINMQESKKKKMGNILKYHMLFFLSSQKMSICPRLSVR